MFGGGYRNPRIRMARIGLLVAVLLAGVVFKHSGGTYDVIRAVYLIAIVGFLVYSFAARSGRVGRGRVANNTSTGPIDVRQSPNPAAAPSLGTAGWFPDPTDAAVERYWDGATWAGTRRRGETGNFGG